MANLSTKTKANKGEREENHKGVTEDKKITIMKQKTMKVKIKKLHPDAVVPSYAHATDCGLDLTAVSKTFDEPEPKPSFAFPKMDEFDKASKELMQTLKSQLGNINNEQRFARRERITLALIHIMGVDWLYDLVGNTTVQDNLKDLVDIVESIIGR